MAKNGDYYGTNDFVGIAYGGGVGAGAVSVEGGGGGGHIKGEGYIDFVMIGAALGIEIDITALMPGVGANGVRMTAKTTIGVKANAETFGGYGNTYIKTRFGRATGTFTGDNGGPFAVLGGGRFGVRDTWKGTLKGIDTNVSDKWWQWLKFGWSKGRSLTIVTFPGTVDGSHFKYPWFDEKYRHKVSKEGVR